MIRPKKNLEGLHRVSNPPENRFNYLRLDKNENIVPLPEDVVSDIQRLITAELISTYPEEIEDLYVKIASWVGLKRENVMLSSGSDAAIKSVFEVFIEEGDEVVLVSPSYAMYYVYCKMFGARLKEVFYDEDLFLDGDKVRRALSGSTKLLCIANPNSPTGTVLPHEDLIKTIEYYKDRDILVLVDEAYYPYYPETIIGLVESLDNLIVTRTFSKACGLASARLGFAASGPRITGLLQKVRPMYEVNAFAVKLGHYILDHADIIDRNLSEMKEGKNYIESAMRDMGFKTFKTYANFLNIEVGSQQTSRTVHELLKEEGILVKGGFKDKCLEKCIRITIGTKDQMKYFVEKFNAVLAKMEVGQR